MTSCRPSAVIDARSRFPSRSTMVTIAGVSRSMARNDTELSVLKRKCGCSFILSASTCAVTSERSRSAAWSRRARSSSYMASAEPGGEDAPVDQRVGDRRGTGGSPSTSGGSRSERCGHPRPSTRPPKRIAARSGPPAETTTLSGRCRASGPIQRSRVNGTRRASGEDERRERRPHADSTSRTTSRRSAPNRGSGSGRVGNPTN